MNKFFNKNDVFSWSNAEDAKQYIGKDCYFAHSVGGLSEHIKTGVMGILKDIFNSNYDAVSCAFGDGTSTWGLCLPADKVIEVEEPTYRPFNSLDELFNFFFPEIIKDNFCDQTEKALFFLGKTLVLKNRYHDYIKVMTIKEVDFINNCSGDGGGDNIELNCFTLLYLFNNFEIKKDGKFVPFGILEK